MRIIGNKDELLNMYYFNEKTLIKSKVYKIKSKLDEKFYAMKFYDLYSSFEEVFLKLKEIFFSSRALECCPNTIKFYDMFGWTNNSDEEIFGKRYALALIIELCEDSLDGLIEKKKNGE